MNRINNLGKVLIFDLDVVGGLHVKKIFGDKALALFVQPPSFEVLEQRLRARATDSEESLQKRLAKVKWELTFFTDFDRVIVNNNLKNAFSEAEIVVESFLKH